MKRSYTKLLGMDMRKKALLMIFFATVCVVISSCGKTVTDAETDTPVIMPQQQEVFLLLTSGSDETVRRGAAFFCNEVSKRSGGSVNVTVMEAVNIASGLGVDAVKFAFVGTFDEPGFCGYFPMLSEPYLFSGYEHFSMTMNSKTVLDELGGVMAAERGIVPLAAFYTGSDFLISSLRIDEYTNFEGMTIDGDEYPQPETIPVVLMNDDNAVRHALYSGMGSIARSEGDALSKMQGLVQGEAQIAEFSIDEYNWITSVPPEDIEIYLTRTFHSASPLWLVADKEYYYSLGAEDRAAIQEVMALMFERIDGQYLKTEQKAIDNILSNGIEKGWVFSNTRQKMREFIDTGIIKHNEAEKRLLRYIYSITVPE